MIVLSGTCKLAFECALSEYTMSGVQQSDRMLPDGRLALVTSCIDHDECEQMQETSITLLSIKQSLICDSDKQTRAKHRNVPCIESKHRSNLGS